MRLINRIRALYVLGLAAVSLATFLTIDHLSSDYLHQIASRDHQVIDQAVAQAEGARLAKVVSRLPAFVETHGFDLVETGLIDLGYRIDPVDTAVVEVNALAASVTLGQQSYIVQTQAQSVSAESITLPVVPRLTEQFSQYYWPVAGLTLLACLAICFWVRHVLHSPLHKLFAAFASLKQGRRVRMQERTGSFEEQLLSKNFNETIEIIEEQQREKVRLALTDPLTRLANRTALQRRLDSYSHQASAALLFIDLDDFKRINDVYGHEAGDKALTVAAQRINDSVRSQGTRHYLDMVARIGGDEFVVLLSPQPMQSDLDAICTRLVDVLCQPIHIDSMELFVGASIGQAVATSGSSVVDSLVKQADMAMYVAKADGKRGWAAFDQSLERDAARVSEVEGHLRHAIENQELRVEFQPIVDCQGVPRGYEALVRWRSPQLGEVSPGEFIPIAEAYGLIESLDVWIANESVSKIASQPGNPFLSLNMSSVHFGSYRFINGLISAVSRHSVDPSRIHVEITETAILKREDDAVEAVSKLRSAGLKVYLDDFGTGYSSLKHLAKFPLDGLKIDVEFVRDVPESTQACLLAQGIATLAQSLALSIVAEGVETEQQREFLTSLGVDYLQGWLFGRSAPLPNPEIIEARVASLSGVEPKQLPASPSPTVAHC